jgi:hypothetical protein
MCVYVCVYVCVISVCVCVCVFCCVCVLMLLVWAVLILTGFLLYRSCLPPPTLFTAAPAGMNILCAVWSELHFNGLSKVESLSAKEGGKATSTIAPTDR